MASTKQMNSKMATRQWLLQRITALLLIPLSFRLVVFLDMCMSKPYAETLAWLTLPHNLAWLVLWVIVVFFHAAIGLHVVVEDYVAGQAQQGHLLKLINLVFLVLAVASLFFMFRSV